MRADTPDAEELEIDEEDDSTEETINDDNEGESDNSDDESASSDEGNEDEKDDNVDDEDKEKDLAAVLGSNKGQQLLQTPKDIPVAAVDIEFNPKQELVALATLEGKVLLYNYNCEENKLKQELSVHSDCCRGILFNEDGDCMYTISKDSSIVVTDINTGRAIHKFNNAHESSIYSHCIIGANHLATGDDDGCVKFWDLRKPDPISSWHHMEDYVSSMVVESSQRTLVCCSGDGTVAAYNVKSRKLITQSEEYNTEPTCLAYVKSETKLAVGTVGKKNPIYFFNYDQYGYHSDKMNGHPNGLSRMLAFSQHILVTGDDYGTLRAIHVFPHRYLGIIGRHQRGFGIEGLSISYDEQYLASCGQDEKVSFWNINYLEDMEKTSFQKRKGKHRQKNLPSSREQNVSDFFADMQEDL